MNKNISPLPLALALCFSGMHSRVAAAPSGKIAPDMPITPTVVAAQIRGFFKSPNPDLNALRSFVPYMGMHSVDKSLAPMTRQIRQAAAQVESAARVTSGEAPDALLTKLTALKTIFTLNLTASEDKRIAGVASRIASQDPKNAQRLSAHEKNMERIVNATVAALFPEAGDSLLVNPLANQVRAGSAPAKSPRPAGFDIGPLKKAVASAQIPEMLDLNRQFWIEKYPATATPQTILKKILDRKDNANILKGFKISSGDQSIKKLATEWRGEAKELADDDSKASATAYLAIANGMEKAFMGAKRFKAVQLASHNIAEDGDIEYQVVLAQQQDGSWLILGYSNFPY